VNEDRKMLDGANRPGKVRRRPNSASLGQQAPEMTPDEFSESVLPQIVTAWDDRCFCANPGFLKLVSFNFRDYDIGPTALADSEILIDAIIRQRFVRRHEPESRHGEVSQAYECPQCGATCTELYAEFSIRMRQSTATFDLTPVLARKGLYLVGFYGFNGEEFGKIHDFQRTSTPDDFIGQLKAGRQPEQREPE
jgi:hypothetical protein